MALSWALSDDVWHWHYESWHRVVSWAMMCDIGIINHGIELCLGQWCVTLALWIMALSWTMSNGVWHWHFDSCHWVGPWAMVCDIGTMTHGIELGHEQWYVTLALWLMSLSWAMSNGMWRLALWLMALSWAMSNGVWHWHFDSWHWVGPSAMVSDISTLTHGIELGHE